MNPETSAPFSIRAAELRDVNAIVQLIRELAEFEHLTHLLQVTPEKLRPHLFGERPVVEALVAEGAGSVLGFALFFTNFSTFLSRPGLYRLAHLPAHRRRAATSSRLNGGRDGCLVDRVDCTACSAANHGRWLRSVRS